MSEELNRIDIEISDDNIISNNIPQPNIINTDSGFDGPNTRDNKFSVMNYLLISRLVVKNIVYNNVIFYILLLIIIPYFVASFAAGKLDDINFKNKLVVFYMIYFGTYLVLFSDEPISFLTRL
jgi:hypothetical protein